MVVVTRHKSRGLGWEGTGLPPAELDAEGVGIVGKDGGRGPNELRQLPRLQPIRVQQLAAEGRTGGQRPHAVCSDHQLHVHRRLC
jgi:hypothetical protein